MGGQEGRDAAAARRRGVVDEEPGEVGERLARAAELALVDLRGARSTEAAMSARRSQRRTWSTPSRAALQTSSALTARSWNSATIFSAAAGSAPRRRAWATTTRNSSWQMTKASSRRRIQATERNSSPPAAAAPAAAASPPASPPGSSSARVAATWRWNASRSASSPDGMAVVSLRSESSERPKEKGEEVEPW